MNEHESKIIYYSTMIAICVIFVIIWGINLSSKNNIVLAKDWEYDSMTVTIEAEGENPNPVFIAPDKTIASVRTYKNGPYATYYVDTEGYNKGTWRMECNKLATDYTYKIFAPEK